MGGNVSQSPYTSRGIFADGKTFILTGGTVNATGGTAAGGSRGIQTTTAPIIYKGTFTAKGNTVAFYNVPTVGTGAEVLGSSVTAGTSPVTITADNASSTNYRYVQITAAGGALPRTTALDFSSSSTNLTYISATGSKSVNPSSDNITDSLEGFAWYKNGGDGYAENTLVLDGINLTANATSALTLPANAFITLTDGSANAIESTYTSASTAQYINAKGALTIRGGGSLTVKGGNASGSAAFDRYGILTEGAFTIESGTLAVANGNITCSGTSGNIWNYGIYSKGLLTMTGGKVTATGGNASGSGGPSSTGVRAVSLNMTGGELTATGGTTSMSGSGSNHSSTGTYTTADTNITGGKITAIGGTATYGSSRGMNVSSGNFTMTGGTIFAKGNTNSMQVANTITGNLEILGNSGIAYDIPAQFNTASPKVIVAATGGATVLDAKIAIATYNITLDQQEGEGGTTSIFAVYGSDMPLITPPVRNNYTFGGYFSSPYGEGIHYYNADGSSAQTWDQTDDITLYAFWTRNEKATEINDDTADDYFEVTGSNLDEVIDRIVTTTDTAAGNKVTLSLNVKDITDETTEVTAIKTLANKGSEVYFFDVTLKKSVDVGGTVTDTALTTVPVPVEIHITLTGDLADKTGYRVYRYHENTAEQLSSDPLRQEYYTVDVVNSEIIIHTMKFSTYAIFGNDAPIDPQTGYDVDVQAKILGAGGAVYKIDLAWGAMTFEYSTSGVWDADTHSYSPGTSVGWKKEGFMNGNNQITAWNHSNGDVNVSFEITQPVLTGVTMQINDSNVLNGTAAMDIPLGRVPNEGDNAKRIEAYLRLDGEPDNMQLLNATYSKIAVITVTIEAVAGSELTPKNMP